MADEQRKNFGLAWDTVRDLTFLITEIAVCFYERERENLTVLWM